MIGVLTRPEAAAGVDPALAPPTRWRSRLTPANLLPLAALAAGLVFLAPRLMELPSQVSVLRGVRWPWLVAAAVAAASTYPIAALGLRAACGRRLPACESTAVQLAAAASNRILPGGVGAVATNLRYLEASGVERADALTAVLVTSATGAAVHLLAGIATFAFPHQRHTVADVLPSTHHGPLMLLVLGLGSLVIGAALAIRQCRELCGSWIRTGARHLAAASARPGRAGVVSATNAGVVAAHLLAFDASLLAFGIHVSLGSAVAAYLAGAAVGAATPSPGGVGPFEAAAAAALGGLGVASGPAVAAVLSFRLITYWLPVAPGAVAFHVLRRRRVL